MSDKVIHCIWLGGEKTKLALKCRASWEKFAPGWRIKEWNDIPASAPKYVKDALAAKKWAFASDWLRFWILEKEGGVYLDFDVELIRPFDDALEELGLTDIEWCATENLKNGGLGFAPGAGICLRKGSAVAKSMIELYSLERFDGSTTVGDLMGMYGLTPTAVVPDVFCPYDWEHKLHTTARTVGIHHYALSWITHRRRIAKWLCWHGMGFLVNSVLWLRSSIGKLCK